MSLILLVSCAKESNNDDYVSVNETFITESSYTRSYSEAEECVNSSLLLLGGATKTDSREIANGGCVTACREAGNVKDTLFYYFNFADNAGFTIINANKKSDPFICITESGQFSDETGTGVPAVDEYLDNVKKELLRFPPGIGIIDDPDPLFPYSYTVTVYDGPYVNPLLTTKWGSTGVFGAFCQYGMSTGLVTAIAQIMAYHGQPSSFILSLPAGSYPLGTTINLSWNNMKQHIRNHSTSQSCDNYHDLISALYADIGFHAQINYFPNGCGYLNNLASSVFYHYGYTAGPLSAVNVSTIKYSLDCSKPVFMCGSDVGNYGQHAWVADGYKDYLVYRYTYAQDAPGLEYYLVDTLLIGEVHALHINWGMQGDCDGYFNFNCYDMSNAVSYDEEGTYSYNFGNDLQMIAGIYY